MNPALWGLSRIYAGLSGTKNLIYDRGWKLPVAVDVPVISLGNLTVGGTGKTPMADFCLRLMLEKGHRPGVVSRSYRSLLKSPARVNPLEPQAAAIYGDEPVWLAKRHSEVPVWSGPRKWETAQAFVRSESVDVIFLDDGFQHRRLHRDLNLVLLDATDGPRAYESLPLGRARESFGNLHRADALLITKTNLASASKLQELRQSLAFSGKPIFEFGLKLGDIPSNGGKFLLVSGIARPESFSALARQTAPTAEFFERIYSDHHPYWAADITEILEQARRLRVDAVLTTEKDEVKLRPLWTGSDIPLRALPLEVVPPASVQSFYELLGSVF
jgi:tetraacyldisaccharide 4'-kinase